MGTTALGQFVNQLAQSFTVPEQYGVYVTKIEVFFQTKSATFPIKLHLRQGKGILATSLIVKNTAAVSANATLPTAFAFDEPIFLAQGAYNFSLESDDRGEYNLWHSKLGDYKLGTTQEKVIKDLAPGSMSPTTAGSVQRIDPDSDIKFKIYRASFSSQSGTAVFRDANPPVRLLGANPLYATAGDLNVHVTHANHGFNVNDRVNIQGVSGTVNGITAVRLNKQHIITGVDYTGYKFALASGANQTATVSYGGSTITATQQYRIDQTQLQMMENKPGPTDILYTGSFTTSKSWAGTEAQYATTPNVSLTNQKNKIFEIPHLIATDSNEATHLSGAESTTITATLSNPSGNLVSPIIDLQRTQLLTVSNQIDRQASSATTNFNVPLAYVAETDPASGSSASKHITKPVTLAVPATGIKVLFAGFKPNTAHFKVFFRTVQTGKDIDILTQAFVEATVDTEMPNSKNLNEFYEYEYTIGGTFASTLAEFDRYQIKIVMESTSTSKVPRIKDLRTLALN